MVGSRSRKPNLRKFLAREVTKKKLKVPESDPPNPTRSESGHNPLTTQNYFTLQIHSNDSVHSSLVGSIHEAEESTSDSLFGDSVDSLFGEPRSTALLREQKLQQLLATSSIAKLTTPKFTESSNLQDLREELKAVVLLEVDGKITTSERMLIERQKGPLIEEIRYRGNVERMAFDKSRTDDKEFPEPIGNKEKQQIEWRKQRLEKADKTPMLITRRQPKRSQEDIDNENDLDGEERLRLGKPIKKRKLQMTGRFRIRDHDVF